MSEVHETRSAGTSPVGGSAGRVYRQTTEQLIDVQQYRQTTKQLIDLQQYRQTTKQLIDLQQYRRPSDRLLYQPTRRAHQLPPLVQEPVQHADPSKAESGSKGEDYYREVYTTWVEIGSIAVGVLAGKFHWVGQEHTGVIFDSVVAMSSDSGSRGKAALVEIDSNIFKASGDLSLSVGDIIELSKQIAATDRDDPLRARKLATLGRMITEIPGLKAQLVRLAENRTIALRNEDSKVSK
jgi:hypothetical protein